jgi:hypothetical protein
MLCSDKLLQLATRLQTDERYFRGWNTAALQGFLRHDGRCVYCGEDLFGDFSVVSCGDHLLPKSIYPHLSQNPANLVPSCGECNQLKRDYDPSEGVDVTDLDAARPKLIENAKAEIERKRAEGDWRNEFFKAASAFRRAATEYQDCLRQQKSQEQTRKENLKVDQVTRALCGGTPVMKLPK